MLFYSTIKLRWISVKRSTVFQICEKLLLPCLHISSCVFCATLLFSSPKNHYGKNCNISEKIFKRKIYHHLFFISGSIRSSKMGVVLRNKIKMNISKWIDAIVSKLTACDSMLGLYQHFFLKGIVNQSINCR